VHEAVVGALVADDLDAGGLERLQVLGRHPGVGGAGDVQRRAGLGAGEGVERLALARAAPHLRDPGHAVEGHRPVEPAGAGGLHGVHAPHAETEDADRLDAGGVGRGHRVAEHAVVVQVAGGRQPVLQRRQVVAPRPHVEGAHDPAVLGGEPGDHLVEQGPEAADVGDDDQPTGGRALGAGDLGGRAGRQGDAHDRRF